MLTPTGEAKKITAKHVAKRIYSITDHVSGYISSEGKGVDFWEDLLSSYIMFKSPTPMLDAVIKYLEEVKAENGRISRPGAKWSPTVGRISVQKNKFLELIAEKLKKENNLDVDPETELVTQGGISPALIGIPMFLCDPGDEVLVVQPDYVRVRAHRIWGTKQVSVPLKERKGVTDETRWYFDPEELEKRVTEKSKLIVFCNPSNPIGYVYSKSDLNAIADIAKKHDLFVLCDECYERHVFSEEFYKTLVFEGIATIPGMKERTFTVQGLVKSYETEGNFRVGWVIGPAEYIKLIKWLQFSAAWSKGTPLGNYAGIAALTLPFREDYIRQQLKIYYQTRETLWETLNQFSWLECGKPMGGQMVFADITKSGMNTVEFGKFCHEQGVEASLGTAWSPEYGLNHIRFSFGSPVEYQKKMNAKLEKIFRYYEVVHKDRIIK